MRENVSKSYAYNPEGLSIFELVAGLTDCITDYPGIGEILIHVHTGIAGLNKYKCLWLFRSKVNSIFFILEHDKEQVTVEILPTGEVIVRPKKSDLHEIAENINKYFIL